MGLKTSGEIKGNWTKFLIDVEGKVVARYEPEVKPELIEEKIIELCGLSIHIWNPFDKKIARPIINGVKIGIEDVI